MDTASLRALFYYGNIEDNWLGHQMAEIFKEGVYRPFLPLLKEHTTVLDVGGNIGLTSIYFSKYFERVITLEPSEEHFDALKRNLESNLITNVTPLRKALYIKNGKFPFGGPKENRTMRSLHMATWQDGKSDEMVDAVTIDTLFEEQKIEKVHLMKLDIEGSEIEVLSSAGFQKIASKIDCIVGERHGWSGRNQHQLDDALKMNGFTVEKVPSDATLFVAQRA